MSFASSYFSRYKINNTIFNNNPCHTTGIIVVIPCFDDEFIFETLNSIENANKPNCNIEVIVIINSGEYIEKKIVRKNQEIYKKLIANSQNSTYKSFNLLVHNFENIKNKIAGVGYARKLGMDEAVRRFNFLNKANAIVCSLDADCLIDKNYFIEITKFFEINSNVYAASLQFQHNFDSNIFSPEEINACKKYEIYLRYFRLSVKSTGFPYPIHTIGSSFCFRPEAYCKIGGMSSRKAGEDFYFLHKLTAITKIGNINKPIVFPAARISNRVPFGTGPSIEQIIKTQDYKVYNFNIFKIINKFYSLIPEFFQNKEFLNNIPEEILNFYTKEKLKIDINEAKQNSSSKEKFSKRFFSKFNAFFIIQFLNSFNEESKFPPKDVLEMASELLLSKNIKLENTKTENIYNQIFKLDLLEK